MASSSSRKSFFVLLLLSFPGPYPLIFLHSIKLANLPLSFTIIKCTAKVYHLRQQTSKQSLKTNPKNGEEPSRRKHQTLRQRNHSRIQEVEIKPVSKHLVDSD